MGNFWVTTKAFIFIVMILVVWATILQQLAPVYAIFGLLSFTGQRGKDFNKNLWMLSDTIVNVILSGWHKVTISAEIGNQAIQGSITGLKVEQIVNWFWNLVFKEKDHCRSVIEPEDKFTFSTKYAVIGFSVFFLVMHTNFFLYVLDYAINRYSLLLS